MISEKGLELLDALEESLREDDAWHSEGGYFEAKDELLDYIATLERQLSDMKEGLSPDEVMDELTPYVEGYSGFTLSKERYWGQYISPYGGAKADSYKKFRGMSIGLWIATEINLHHEETIREAQRRQINADIKRFYWDLNPESPNAEIYRKFIDVYEEKSESGQLKGGFNLITFNIFDNINLSKENLDEEISKYEVGSVYYKRDILGLRCAAEGIVFQDFAENADKYIIDRKDVPKDLRNFSVGFDIGGNLSNYSLVASAVDRQNNVYVLKAKEILPQDLRPADVENAAKDFISSIEKEYGIRANNCYVDDAYYTIINGLNDWRYIFDNAACIKSSMPLQDRPLMLSKLMAQGKFKLVKGECEPLIEQLQNAVYDPKCEKAVILDDGTINIDCIDGLFYSIANEYAYLTD